MYAFLGSFLVPNNYSNGPRLGWEEMFNYQLSQSPKWSEVWVLGTSKLSKISLLGTLK